MNDVIKRINFYRANHQSPPITLDGYISKISQHWAEYLTSKGAFYHSDNNYGENITLLAVENSKSVTDMIIKVIDMWYEEEKYYSQGFSAHTGHFTALVWRSTQKIGLGVCSSPGKILVVMNFEPAGNIIGQFHLNVLPSVHLQRNPSFNSWFIHTRSSTKSYKMQSKFVNIASLLAIYVLLAIHSLQFIIHMKR